MEGRQQSPLQEGGPTLTEDAVRDVLVHLYYNAYLQHHPLLSVLVPRHMPDPMSRAQSLRSLAMDAIQTLRPPDSAPPDSREWRVYHALTYRYIDGMSDERLQRELSVSPRQLYRYLKSGIEALCRLLQERAEASDPAEVEALASSLKRVGLQLERVDPGQLAEEALPIVSCLAQAMGRQIHVNRGSGGARAVADLALSRQALISALTHALKAARSDVSVAEESEGAHECLVIRFAPEEPTATLPDDSVATRDAPVLSLAAQLMAQQGGALSVSGSSVREIRFAWPRFEEPAVLIVEDDPAMLRLFGRYLAGHGYRVLATGDGREAVELAADNGVCLVVLDVMMRNVDGWTVLQELKVEPATRGIPVMVCSVVNEPELALTLGAAAVLKKPVSREQFLDAVAGLVGI